MSGLVFGWEEWAALPSLGLPAVRAKLDTGARTSVLHALEVEPFGPSGRPRVRFQVPEAEGPGRECEAELHDQRAITSSNGRAEVRCIILTAIRVGAIERTVELSLTDRNLMTYPMLLGRRALAAFGATVDPARSWRVSAGGGLG